MLNIAVLRYDKDNTHMTQKTVNKTNMTLQGYYASLVNQRTKFIQDLVDITGFTYRTIQRYLSGEITPEKPTRKIIADFLETEEEILWPKIKQA